METKKKLQESKSLKLETLLRIEKTSMKMSETHYRASTIMKEDGYILSILHLSNTIGGIVGVTSLWASKLKYGKATAIGSGILTLGFSQFIYKEWTETFVDSEIHYSLGKDWGDLQYAAEKRYLEVKDGSGDDSDDSIDDLEKRHYQLYSQRKMTKRFVC